jgi:hypothetical protein
VPSDPYAQSVFSSIQACLACCKHTKDVKSVQLVKAGNSYLSVHYDNAKNALSLHEKWVNKSSSAKDLHLPENINTSYVVFHAVKQLFEEALDQRLASRQDQTAVIIEKKQQRNLIDQKLLTYCSIMGSLAVSCTKGGLSAVQLQWAGNFTKGYRGYLTVQLHRESTCSHLKAHRLARDCE